MDQVSFLAVHVVSRVEYSAFFHLGDTTWNAYHHFQMAEQVVAAAHHFDHALDHGFRCLEIGNNAVFQRAYGFDIFVGLFVHLHGPMAYSDRIAAPAVDGYNGKLIHHNLIVYHDQRVGSTQVNC